MGNTAIVSCTSSDLTPQQAQELSVRLVPLTVSFGDETYEAVTELTNEDFYRKLTAPGAPFPRTAAPNPARFQAAFQEAFDAGAEGVVCITISAEMSATYAAAVQAAGEFEPGLVDVIDSRIVTQPQGLIVKRAADLAATGAEQAEVVDLVHDLVGRVRILFTPETLEYLQRGGRIGRASALLGSVLSIKPILGVEDGAVVTVDKKRTSAKTRRRLLELVAAYDAEEVAVLHTGVPDLETYRAQVAEAAGQPVESLEVGMAGPVAGAHVGPGMVGVSLILTA
ncbi:MAG: DegV family protein [Chloroflexota bacterium]|jgi:DegV family protein with EDD domain